mmetsp:Transcript_54877/g.174420  ORF Transcript_54877/g.174420 Transcript_54877/m.174420 type:complete len:106 (+) Transcript_54877:417-734(+)
MFLPWYGMLALVLCGLCCLVSSYKCYKWRRRRRLHAALYGGSQRYQEAVALKKESIFKKMFTRSSRKYKKKDHLSQVGCSPRPLSHESAAGCRAVAMRWAWFGCP